MKLNGRRAAAAMIVCIAGASLSACAGDPGSQTGGSSATSLKGTTIAVFVPTKANTYYEASLRTIEEEADKLGASVQVFDAGFDPSKQYTQIQDAIATGRYKSMLIAPLDGPATAALLGEAASANIVVAGFNQPMTADLTGVDSLPEGLVAQVLRPVGAHGTAIGEMTVEACENIDPCEIGYLNIQKGLPVDTALREKFDAAIADSPNIEVVAEGDAMATQEGGLTAAQDMLTAHPEIDIFVGADKAVLGAAEAAGSGSKAAFIGIGGSGKFVAGIKEGRFFGSSATVPKVEARLAVEALARAVKTGEKVGGIDPVLEAKVPDDGKITRANVDEFSPEFDG